jgi:hypothetical protein
MLCEDSHAIEHIFFTVPVSRPLNLNSQKMSSHVRIRYLSCVNADDRPYRLRVKSGSRHWIHVSLSVVIVLQCQLPRDKRHNICQITTQWRTQSTPRCPPCQISSRYVRVVNPSSVSRHINNKCRSSARQQSVVFCWFFSWIESISAIPRFAVTIDPPKAEIWSSKTIKCSVCHRQEDSASRVMRLSEWCRDSVQTPDYTIRFSTWERTESKESHQNQQYVGLRSFPLSVTKRAQHDWSSLKVFRKLSMKFLHPPL